MNTLMNVQTVLFLSCALELVLMFSMLLSWSCRGASIPTPPQWVSSQLIFTFNLQSPFSFLNLFFGVLNISFDRFCFLHLYLYHCLPPVCFFLGWLVVILAISFQVSTIIFFFGRGSCPRLYFHYFGPNLGLWDSLSCHQDYLLPHHRMVAYLSNKSPVFIIF